MEECLFIINDDGVLRPYNPEYDVTIHCESEEAQDRVIRKLITPNYTGDIDINEAAKALKAYCAKTKCNDCAFHGIERCKVDRMPCMWDLEVEKGELKW
ncbi:MAG: hypothetical protein ACI4JC_01265 [Faecalibacterium sp.]